VPITAAARSTSWLAGPSWAIRQRGHGDGRQLVQHRPFGVRVGRQHPDQLATPVTGRGRLAAGRQDQHPDASELAHQVCEQQRRLVRPLNIVQDQEQAAAFRGLGRPLAYLAEQGEALPAVELRVAARGAPRRLAERQRPQVGPRLIAAAAGQVLQGQPPQPVRRCDVPVARAGPGDRRSLRRNQRRGLPGQPGLADPGLACAQQQAPATARASSSKPTTRASSRSRPTNETAAVPSSGAATSTA
jgi:hypothetical protein